MCGPAGEEPHRLFQRPMLLPPCLPSFAMRWRSSAPPATFSSSFSSRRRRRRHPRRAPKDGEKIKARPWSELGREMCPAANVRPRASASPHRELVVVDLRLEIAGAAVLLLAKGLVAFRLTVERKGEAGQAVSRIRRPVRQSPLESAPRLTRSRHCRRQSSRHRNQSHR